MKTQSRTSFFRVYLLGLILIVCLANDQTSIVYAQEPPLQDKFVYLPVVVTPTPPVEILGNYTYSVDPYDGRIYVYGEVINHTTSTIDILTINVETFDSNGTFIKTVPITISILLTPSSSYDDKSCFNFYLIKELRADPDIASFRFKNVQYQISSNIYFKKSKGIPNY